MANHQRLPSVVRTRRFTLVELLAVISVLTVLLFLLLPSFKTSHAQARALLCANNMRQLTMSWLTYAGDNQARLVSLATYGDSSRDTPWVYDVRSGTYNDKVEQGIKRGVLWPYVGNEKNYQCPDHPFAREPAKKLPRNYSGNAWLHALLEGVETAYVYDFSSGVSIRMSGQIAQPDKTYVFCEEADNRGDLWGAFIVTYGSLDRWCDPIGSWHDLGSTFSFADGHAEYWKWQDYRTIYTNQNPGAIPAQPGNPDLLRMQKTVCPGAPDDLHKNR